MNKKVVKDKQKINIKATRIAQKINKDKEMILQLNLQTKNMIKNHKEKK